MSALSKELYSFTSKLICTSGQNGLRRAQYEKDAHRCQDLLNDRVLPRFDEKGMRGNPDTYG